MKKDFLRILVAVLFISCGLVFMGCEGPKQDVIVKYLPNPGDTTTPTPDDDETWQSIYTDNIKSVVKVVIQSCSVEHDYCWDAGHGSGFIVSDGVIATNWHVAEKYFEAYYDEFPEDITYYRLVVRYPAEATLLRNTFLDQDYVVTGVYDGLQGYDIALLKVNTLGRKPVTLSDKRWEDFKQFNPVMTLGYPQLFDFVATTGPIQETFYNKDKNNLVYWVASETKLLKIGAQIDQGNSGGPLFDKNGKVIGINFALYMPNWVVHYLSLSIDHLKTLDLTSVNFKTQPIPTLSYGAPNRLVDNTSELNPVDETEHYYFNVVSGCIYVINGSEVSYIDPNTVTPAWPIMDMYVNGLYMWYGWPVNGQSSIIHPAADSGNAQIDVYTFFWNDPAPLPGWYNITVDEYCPL